MDEPQMAAISTPPAPQAVPPPRPTWRTDLALVGLLALLTLGLRTCQIARTEVTARDSITYIHIAWRMTRGDFLAAVKEAPQHPGYPLAVAALSPAVHLFVGGDEPYAWQLSAQVASAAASVLLVVPLYFLGKEWFGRRVGFWAALVFEVLPASGGVMADGLSEALFLLFAASALALASAALRRGWALGFGLAGLCGGLAYLTRPEGLLLPAASGAALLAAQCFARFRRPWPHTAARAACLCAGFLAVGAPFMGVIGGLTQKRTGNAILGAPREGDDWTPPAGATNEPRSGLEVGRAPLAMWWTGDPANRGGRWLWAAGALAEVLSKGFFYVLWVPALAGLFWFGRRFAASPSLWVAPLLCAALTAALYLVAGVMGYLSDRHTLLIVLCGVFWAVAAVEHAGRKAAAALASRLPAPGGGRAWSAALLVLLVAAPLPVTLAPLHADRTGFREAGAWLAAHADPGDGVFDPFGWAAYYSGRALRADYRDADHFTADQIGYVVVERGASGHSHLAANRWAEMLAEIGTPVCRIPAPRGRGTAYIEIYSLRRP